MSESSAHNPFEAPREGRPVSPSIPTAPFPKCGDVNVDAPSFAWWGGALGPKMFSHVICRNCNTGFNKKSGKSNATAIAIYVGISLVVGLGVALLFIVQG